MAHMNFLSDLTLANLQDLFNSANWSLSILGEGGGWRDGVTLTNEEIELLFQQVFDSVGINQEPSPTGDPFQGLMPAVREGTAANFEIFLRSLNDWSIVAQTAADNNPDTQIRVNDELIPFSDALKRIGEAMKERAVKQRELELNIFPHDVESMQPYQSNGVTLYVHSGMNPSTSLANDDDSPWRSTELCAATRNDDWSGPGPQYIVGDDLRHPPFTLSGPEPRTNAATQYGMHEVIGSPHYTSQGLAAAEG